MFRNQAGQGLGDHQLVPVLRQPALAEYPCDLLSFAILQGPVVEVRRGAGYRHYALAIDFQELQPI